MIKDVPYPEYAPFYSITDEGRVISKKTGAEVKAFNKHHGYLKVKLRANGAEKSASVARMVALAFIPTDDTSKDVDHIDNNKLNNHVSNLQWLTRAENVAKSYKQGRVGSRKGKVSGKLTGLYLSHEAIDILKTVDNKSKYVDRLIKADVTPTQNTPLPKNTKVSVNGDKPTEIKPGGVIDYQGKTPPVIVPVPQKNTPTATPRVDDLVSADLPDAKDILQANMEQVCCKNELQPCKHWVWDSQTGEGYKNSLSGRLMEVE